jgi:hypothetical protein
MLLDLPTFRTGVNNKIAYFLKFFRIFLRPMWLIFTQMACGWLRPRSAPCTIRISRCLTEHGCSCSKRLGLTGTRLVVLRMCTSCHNSWAIAGYPCTQWNDYGETVSVFSCCLRWSLATDFGAMKNWTDDKPTSDFGQKLKGVAVCTYCDARKMAQCAYWICGRND